MTANELVDKLESVSIRLLGKETEQAGRAIILYRESAIMLRKQQAEIEALKEPKIPLLEQEIKFILGNGQCWQGEDCSMPNLMYIIRAVEAAHGIGVKQDEHL